MSVQGCKYREVTETLKGEILGAKYAKNPFPSVVGIMRRFGISRATAVRVQNELKKRGLIKCKQGRGAFVVGGGLSRKIGILFPETASSEYYSWIIRAISSQAQASGYALLFAEIDALDISTRADQAEQVARNFVEHGVAGVIFQPVAHVPDSARTNRKILSVFDAVGVPVVLCDCDYELEASERSGYDVVGVDNFVAGAMLFRHLREAGARRIHFITIAHSARSHQDRLRGAMMECRRLTGAGWPKANTLIAPPDDCAVIRRHVRKHRPDAFICGNDITAVLLIRTLGKLGLRVPDDVLVTGFNDVTIGRLATPSVTTVRQPTDVIGRVAFRRLLERMGNPALPSQSILLSASLIARESTARTARSRDKKLF